MKIRRSTKQYVRKACFDQKFCTIKYMSIAFFILADRVQLCNVLVINSGKLMDTQYIYV